MATYKADFYRVAFKNGHMTKRHKSIGDAVAHAARIRGNNGSLKHVTEFWIEHVVISKSVTPCALEVRDAALIGMI